MSIKQPLDEADLIHCDGQQRQAPQHGPTQAPAADAEQCCAAAHVRVSDVMIIAGGRQKVLGMASQVSNRQEHNSRTGLCANLLVVEVLLEGLHVRQVASHSVEHFP